MGHPVYKKFMLLKKQLGNQLKWNENNFFIYIKPWYEKATFKESKTFSVGNLLYPFVWFWNIFCEEYFFRCFNLAVALYNAINGQYKYSET